MRRRAFITLLGAAAAWPLAARGQPAKTIWRIGVLGPGLSSPFASTLYQAFLAQLRELGFSEGQNLVAEYQAMDDARGPFVATIELMRSQPDLVVALGPEVALQALVGASGSVPIVFIAILILTTPITLSGSFSALPTLLSFSFLPSRLLASTQLCARHLGPLECHWTLYCCCK